MRLTDPCYKLLQQIDEKLATAVSVTRRLDSGTMRELIRWCQTHELPTADWVSGRQARFEPAILVAIDELLQQLGQPGIHQVHSGQARLEQAQYGNRENKNHGQPMQGRLLVCRWHSWILMRVHTCWWWKILTCSISAWNCIAVAGNCCRQP